MNFIEIKIFQQTKESREFKKLNEGEVVPCNLFQITPMSLDFDRIVAYFPHCDDENVTNIDLVGSNGSMIPMKYEKFKEFYNNKMKINT
jgi:hypothetical protein